jgi:transcriptional regulator GlxA family with amidase domain
LVEDDLGSATALAVARMMVVFLRRPGGQSQFSATLAAQASASPQLGDLLAWMPDNLRRGLSVDQLARRVAMSPRNFARLFRREVGTTPGKHVEDLRLEAARRHLESTGESLAQVAGATGFRSAETLGRAFVRRFGITPGQYRATFGMAGIVGPLSENALRDRGARL